MDCRKRYYRVTAEHGFIFWRRARPPLAARPWASLGLERGKRLPCAPCEEENVLSDLEISQAAKLKPIWDIAEGIGIGRNELELYGD